MTATTPPNPLDRALSLSIGGAHEEALAVATALLEATPESPMALLLMGRGLRDSEQGVLANTAFELSLGRALRAGNFPLAVAAYRELCVAGVAVDRHLTELSTTFARGSQHLIDQRMPPDLAQNTRELVEHAERGQELLAIVESALEHSQELFARDSEQPLRVPPQVPFSSLEPQALSSLVGAFETRAVDTGDVLIAEGTPGSEAYILARGELEVQRRSRDPEAAPIALARLGAGALFGEMSLLSRSPRAASVVACRPSIVLIISKQALDEVAEAEPDVARVLAQFTRKRMIENLVRTSSILGAVRATKRADLLERFVTKTFEAGEKLIEQGEESSGLYLVASGLLSVIHRSDDEQLAISKLGPGEVVGEVALVLRRPSNADVVAEHPTVTLHLPRDEFLDLIKAHPEVLAELYELAVKRDEETRSLVAQEATDAEEFVLL